jgi:group I intron endonuclease
VAILPQSPFGVVYIIHNTTSGLIYIGKTTKSVHIRWREHRKELVGGRHRNSHLLHSWQKHGASAFEFGVLEASDTEADLNAAEVFYIAYFRAIGAYIVNLRGGGEGGSWSGDVLRRIAAARKGKPLSEETRQKLREASRNRPPQSEATRQKRSKTMRGREFSPLARQRRIESGRGKPLTPAHRSKLRLAIERRRARTGYAVSPETQQKMRERMRGVKKTRTPALEAKWEAQRGRREHPEQTKKRIDALVSTRPVRRFRAPDGTIYETRNVTELARQHDLHPRLLAYVVSGKQHHHRGWTLVE